MSIVREIPGDAVDTRATLHVGCGEDYRNYAVNLDVSPDVGADVVHNLDEPWPFDDSRFRRIEAQHVLEHVQDLGFFFAEAARVLEVGSTLDVTVPLGQDAQDDPTHRHHWGWRTPEFYTHNGRGRHWGDTSPFELQHRDVNVWMAGPESRLSPLMNVLAAKWPRWAIERAAGGELRAVYRRCPR